MKKLLIAGNFLLVEGHGNYLRIIMEYQSFKYLCPKFLTSRIFSMNLFAEDTRFLRSTYNY